LNKEYNDLLRCIGYSVSIILSSTNIISTRLLNVSLADDTLILYLTNDAGIMFITKNGSEVNQYAIQLKGNKSNAGFYTSDYDIKDKYSTLSFVNI